MWTIDVDTNVINIFPLADWRRWIWVKGIRHSRHMPAWLKSYNVLCLVAGAANECDVKNRGWNILLNIAMMCDDDDDGKAICSFQ